MQTGDAIRHRRYLRLQRQAADPWWPPGRPRPLPGLQPIDKTASPRNSDLWTFEPLSQRSAAQPRRISYH